MIVVDKTLANLQLTLTVSNGGGIPGISATVAIRNAATTNSYMDWADGAFKTSGWTTKNGAMTDLTDGIYVRNLPIASNANITAGAILSAEYTAPAFGIDVDMIEVTTSPAESADLILLRKMMTNKLLQTSGNPGQVVLYDDDATTPLKTWTLLDETGGAVLPATGVPARRSAAT